MTPAVHPGLGGDDEAPSEAGIDGTGINKSAPFDRGADTIRALHGPHHNNLSLQNDVDPTTTTSTTTTTTRTTRTTETAPTTTAAAAAVAAAAAATTLALAGASPASTCFPSPPSDALRDKLTIPWTSSAAKEPLPDAHRQQHQQLDLQLQPESQASRFQSDLASKSQRRSRSQPPLGLDPEPEPEPEPKPKPKAKPKPSPNSNSNLESEPDPLAIPPSEPRAPRLRNYPWSADSHDSIPTQTIVKALASIASASESPRSSPLPPLLQNMNMCPPRGTTATSSSSSSAIASPQQLAEALQDLANKRAASGSALANMLSPCFYHQRFDDAVDIDRVLDEIQGDEAMFHCRLAQTAASVREVSKQLRRRPIRRAVRNIMIVTKARDNQLVYHTRELATWLLKTPRYGSDVGVNVYVDAKLRASKRFDAAGIVAMDPRFEDMLKYWTPDLCWSQPEKFDLVLTLGGDGTVLFTSWLFQRIVPPVLSFSLGSLGFMTTFEFENYKKHLDRVMGDDGMKVNLRMRFTCTVWRSGSGSKDSKGFPLSAKGNPMDEGEQFEVLNELVIDRGPSPYVSNLELYGDDELLTVVQADGCIFSTPTGSTAYSLSAGGSLVHPDIPAILLTPICPHTLSFRPMVLSDTMALRVVVPRNSRATAYCAFDGKGRIELRQGDHVTITASQYPFPTVTRTDTEWFDSVSRTLRWNVRAAAQKPFSDNGDEDDCASWDIDTDSAYYASEEGSEAASPVRRQMSMLGL